MVENIIVIQRAGYACQPRDLGPRRHDLVESGSVVQFIVPTPKTPNPSCLRARDGPQSSCRLNCPRRVATIERTTPLHSGGPLWKFTSQLQPDSSGSLYRWIPLTVTSRHTVEALAADYKGKIKVAKLDVDDNPEAAGRFGVRSIPTLIVFKDGEAQETAVGVRPKGQLAELIDQYIQ